MGDEVELIDDVELEGVSNDGADDVSVEDMDEDEGPVTSYISGEHCPYPSLCCLAPCPQCQSHCA